MPEKRHLLTIALEDYFQVGAFNRVIQRGQWYRFETRLARNTDHVLALLDQYNLKATFFVLGWVADQYPELVRRVAERGHEIASKGYYHRGVQHMSPAEFREDLLRSREALEKAGGRRVLGFRLADGWFTPADLWALDVLAECGFAYDSSIAPRGRQFADEPFRRFAHQEQTKSGSIWEFPISTARVFGHLVPIAGGNYFRQIPPWLIRRAVARWHAKVDAPFVLYFHAWEIDPEQPKINVPWLQGLRHYRNLDKMQQRLEYFFRRYPFGRVVDHLHLDDTLQPLAASLPRTSQFGSHLGTRKPAPETRMPVTVVVPCYNEELILPYLANTLRSVEEKLAPEYDLTFVLVDDGSSDGTGPAMRQTFGAKPNFRLLRHDRNRGVTAAILTGIGHAETDIVCSIDCDCTYDPHELGNMIPLLRPGVDLVTASPYHAEGGVRNVPGWRLFLSRGASWLYRRVLRNQLATYTSCFRVYRKSAVEALPIRETGFLGVAELLGRLDLKGAKIVEYPAVLEVRMIGRSKMKTVRTIFGHLRLMVRLLAARAFRPLASGGRQPPDDSQKPPVDEEQPGADAPRSTHESPLISGACS